MGVGPEDIAANDDIYVVNGSRVPFILRTIENAAATSEYLREDEIESHLRLHLVDHSYVHRIMDEEAWEESTGVKASPILLRWLKFSDKGGK